MRPFLALVTTVAIALMPTIVWAHGTEVSVSGEVRPNGPIEIEGADFEANDVVRIELRKEGVEPIELGRIPVEADGSFAITLHVPQSVSPGIYELACDGEESATTQVTILESAAGEPDGATEPEETHAVSNDAPAGETVGLAALTAALAVMGAGLVWLSRPRPHRTIS